MLLGDSVHAFGDGVLVAAAFMADLHLGLAASVAVLAHEVPHHVGALLLCASAPADHTIVHGRRVVSAGQLTTLDLPPLVEKHNRHAIDLARQA